MRFRSLDLARYGAFTDRRMTFQPEARLHLIYGPNEAGKSTALAAIADLLYGFGKSTVFDFLHKSADLMIGADIAANGGSCLAFQRRKKNKSALTAPDGAALEESALHPFLGGLSRQNFLDSFGLDAARLRSGADALMEPGASSSAALFAAASGLHSLRGLSDGLDKDADELLGRKGAQRKLNIAMERSEAALMALRKAELRTPAWTELNAQIERVNAQIAEINQRRRAAHAEQSALQNLKHAIIAVEKAGQDVQQAETAAKTAESALATIAVDEAILLRAEDIVALRDTSAHRKFLTDLPRVEEEADEFREALKACAVKLGLKDMADVEARQPSALHMARVQELSAKGRALMTRLDQLIEARDAETARLSDLERKRAEAGASVDPAELRTGFEALSEELTAIAQRPRIAGELAAETAALGKRAATLQPPAPDVDRLAELPLPSTETIQRYKQSSEVLAQELRDARKALQTAEDDARSARTRLKEYASSGAPVTRADVEAARMRRDGLWQQLLPMLLEGKPANPQAGLVQEFTAAVIRADQLSDQAGAQAELAAKFSLQRIALEMAEAAIVQSSARLAELTERIDTELLNWRQEWSACGIAPKPAAEMASWLVEVKNLLASRSRLETLRAQLQVLEDRARRLQPALLAMCRRAGLMADGQIDAILMGRELEAHIATLERRWSARRELEALWRDAQSKLSAMAAKQQDAGAALAHWRQGWIAAAAALCLPADLAPLEAVAPLAVWAEVPALIKERINREQRVHGMRRDMAAYEARCMPLAEAFAPDLLKTAGMLATIERLVKRCEEAKRAEQTRTQAARSLAEKVAIQEKLQSGLRQAEAHRDAIAALLQAELDPTGIDGRLDQLALELETIAEAAPRLFAGLQDLNRERAAMESSSAAELAQADLKQAEAETVELARDWAVLKLGAKLVTEVMKRRRATEESRLLNRAGALFATLTGGRFIGFSVDYDEAETQMLMARRASGELMPVSRLKDNSALSEGTRDQVYLALRLAFLEDYASRAEPAPFIGDDLFVSFDDERTGHGLAVLAEASARLQPILFTHHRAVVEIARARLGAGVDVIELG